MRWGRVAFGGERVVAGAVLCLAAAAGCDDPRMTPRYTDEEWAELLAQDCAAMTCEGPQVAIAGLKAEVAALPDAEAVVLDRLEAACRAAAGAVGVEVVPPGDESPAARAEHVCAEAAVAIAGQEVGVLGTSGGLEGCGATLAEVEACEASCACAGCPARTVAATCDGTLVGRCDGRCTGWCWPAEEGGTVACDGACFGRCEGTCDGVADELGRCRGTCAGRCEGPCNPGADTAAVCDGTCDACSAGSMTDARCIAGLLDGGWSIHEDAACAACSSRCTGVAGASGWCLPLPVDPAGRADALVEALVDLHAVCLQLAWRADLREILSDEAAVLLDAAHPGGFCVVEQLTRLGELDPLPTEACWAALRAPR